MVIGSALDILEHCGVPRTLFVDLPLGNPCGPPGDRASNRTVLSEALALLAEAEAPDTTRRSSVTWPTGDDWRATYNRVDDSNREALAEVGRRRRSAQNSAAPQTP